MKKSRCRGCGRVEDNNAENAAGEKLPWGWALLSSGLICERCFAATPAGAELGVRVAETAAEIVISRVSPVRTIQEVVTDLGGTFVPEPGLE